MPSAPSDPPAYMKHLLTMFVLLSLEFALLFQNTSLNMDYYNLYKGHDLLTFQWGT